MAGLSRRPVRVVPAPQGRLEDDEACEIAEDATAVLENFGDGRWAVHGSGDQHDRALVGSDHRGPTGTRVIEVVVNGWRFDLEVEDAARAELIEKGRRTIEALGHGGPLEIRAIIPGRIVAVAVAVGDTVTAGQRLLVVEAMKMQNELRAPRAGTVERLAASVGATVDLGDLLVVIGQA